MLSIGRRVSARAIKPEVLIALAAQEWLRFAASRRKSPFG
jgi:hypothetical protein